MFTQNHHRRIAEGRGRIRSLGKFPNRAEAVPQAHRKARRRKESQGLLRSRPNRVCALLAAHQAGRRLRGHRAVAHSKKAATR